MLTEKKSLRLLMRQNSRYVVPNAITAGNMIMGMISIFYATQGMFMPAAWIIMYSVILDKLDGSMARALKASSDFGTQLDSFSDFLAFGVTPAFLSLMICLKEPAFEADESRLFLFFSLVLFVLISSMRLARFNVTTMPGNRYMYGLATTAGGGIIAVYLLTALKYYPECPLAVEMLEQIPLLFILLSALEISNIPMVKVGHKKPIWMKLIEIIGFATLIICTALRRFPELLLIFSSTFAVVGFIHGYLAKRAEDKTTVASNPA